MSWKGEKGRGEEFFFWVSTPNELGLWACLQTLGVSCLSASSASHLMSKNWMPVDRAALIDFFWETVPCLGPLVDSPHHFGARDAAKVCNNLLHLRVMFKRLLLFSFFSFWMSPSWPNSFTKGTAVQQVMVHKFTVATHPALGFIVIQASANWHRRVSISFQQVLFRSISSCHSSSSKEINMAFGIWTLYISRAQLVLNLHRQHLKCKLIIVLLSFILFPFAPASPFSFVAGHKPVLFLRLLIFYCSLFSVKFELVAFLLRYTFSLSFISISSLK